MKIRQIINKAAFGTRYSAIGLDIGSSQVKAIQLCRAANREDVHRLACLPLPAGSIREGRIQHREPLVQVLSSLLEQGWHKKRAYLSLSGQVTFLRAMELPLMPPCEVPRAVRWEAERLLAMPLSEAVYDYAELGVRTRGKNQVLLVLLAVVPKVVVEQYTGVAVQAGFFPAALEVVPLSLLRSLQRGPQSRLQECNETILVLNIGANSTDLLILHRGRLRLYRNLAAQPDQLPRQAAVSLEYHARDTAYPAEPCRSVLLCGGGAADPDLRARLKKELGLPVHLYNPLSGYAGQEAAARFAVAHGLALRGWHR